MAGRARMLAASVLAAAACALACSGQALGTGPSPGLTHLRSLANGTIPLRVVLGTGIGRVRVASDEPLILYDIGLHQPVLQRERRDLVLANTGDQSQPIRVTVGEAQPSPAVSVRGRRFSVGPERDLEQPLRIRFTSAKTGRVVLDGEYRGDVLVEPDGSGALRVINRVALDDYIAGVLGPEIGASAPTQALMAQAIAARSYALARAETARNEPYDVRPSTYDQVYGGSWAETEATRRAARDSSGLVLEAEGGVVQASYHACCGGTTANPESIWGSRIDGIMAVFDGSGPGVDLTREDDARHFLTSSPGDIFCKRSPNFRWRVRYSAEALSANLVIALPRVRREGRTAIGELRDVRVVERAVSGHVTALQFVGAAGSATVRGDAIRWAFGSGETGGRGLRSTFFAVDKAGKGPPYTAYEVFGAGWGHGVGMCQAGAVEMASRGFEYASILRHYYRTARVVRLVDGSAQ